jgi:hypothetical protein
MKKILIIVILVVMVGVAGYLYFNTDNSKQTSNNINNVVKVSESVPNTQIISQVDIDTAVGKLNTLSKNIDNYESSLNTIRVNFASTTKLISGQVSLLKKTAPTNPKVLAMESILSLCSKLDIYIVEVKNILNNDSVEIGNKVESVKRGELSLTSITEYINKKNTEISETNKKITEQISGIKTATTNLKNL